MSAGVSGVGFVLPPQDDPVSVVVVVVVVVVVEVVESVVSLVAELVVVVLVSGVLVAGIKGVSIGFVIGVFGVLNLLGITTFVPENIVFPPLYFLSSVNFGFAAKIALTVVLFSFAIELRVSPFLTVTFIGAGGLGGFNPALW